MNTLHRPQTWRDASGYPGKSQQTQTFPLSGAYKCRDGGNHRGIFKLFDGGGGDGADYNVTETGTSKMFGSSKDFPR